MENDPDFDLVRRCQSETGPAREAAFAELFENYRDRVFSLAFRMLGSVADAEDVAQEAFVTVFRKIQEFRFSSRFYTWLYRVVFNLCVDARRRGNGGVTTLTGEDAETTLSRLRDPSPSPSETVGDEESRNRTMERALRRLSDPLRVVIVLRYLEDMQYGEIADVLGISVGTVKSRLNRAHQFLQNVLKPPA